MLRKFLAKCQWFQNGFSKLEFLNRYMWEQERHTLKQNKGKQRPSNENMLCEVGIIFLQDMAYST